MLEAPDGDVVAVIDAAVDGTCACGCGTALCPSGPSAWFASETCQWRWQAGRHPHVLRAAVDLGAAQVALAQLGEAFTQLAAAWLPELDAAVREVNSFCEQIRPLLPEQPPTDPMERALWARRNRNTGPAAAQRAPRRIDPPGRGGRA